MSTPLDLVGLTRSFLTTVEPHLSTVPDPFSHDFTMSSQCGGHQAPHRLLGPLAKLVQDDREITRRSVRDNGILVQKFISNGLLNSSVFYGELLALFSSTESERLKLRESWYGSLAVIDRAAIDAYCLAITGHALLPHVPPTLPESLHGSLARLAIEYAAIGKRFATTRDECRKSLPERGLGNRTIVTSVLRGFTHDEEKAKSQLVGQWFRELALKTDEAVAQPSPAAPLRKPRRPAKKPDIPLEYKKPLKLLPKFQDEHARARTRWTVTGFCAWLTLKHSISIKCCNFKKWLASYNRGVRRAKGKP